MRIAVVGDLHGHLALMYAILGRWQQETSQHIDLILQVGDVGSFPAGRPVDRATQRHAERDPEELGFAEFAGDAPPATILDPRPPLVFIPGNHEDFEFLEERESRAPGHEVLYPVSNDGTILALRSGSIWTCTIGDSAVRIAGVSGIAQESAKPRHPKYRLRLDHIRALRGRDRFDILISHEGPKGIPAGTQGSFGSTALAALITESQPPLAFFGHYDLPGVWRAGRSVVFGLSSCGYGREPHWPLNQGSVVLVTWDRTGPVAEPLAAPWLADATRDSWRGWK